MAIERIQMRVSTETNTCRYALSKVIRLKEESDQGRCQADDASYAVSGLKLLA